MPVPAPRILPGRLHKDNKGCVDWGCQNLVAYGCNSYVVVVDPSSMAVIQTLDEHTATVCLVKWPNEAIRQDNTQYLLRLASGDAAGNIIVWNVHEGSVIATMTDKPLIDMKWHPEDTSLIAALHAPNSVCLWNVTSGTRIWKKDVSDHSCSTFIFDPFEPSFVTVASTQGFIYAMQDFKATATPSQVDFKYKINSRASKQAAGKQAPIDFVQMTYSPHSRHVVYIMLSRELLIFDTTTNQSLGSVVLERNRSSFAQMCLYKENPELLFCLHEDGAITAWIRKKDNASSHNYEMVSIGDLAYLNKKSKKKATPVVGFAKAPCSDHSMAAVCADGSLCTWDFISSRLSVTGTLSPLTSTITSICVSPFDDVNPKVAFGTLNGTIMIADFQTRKLEREFVVGPSSQAIHGVKWIGSTRVVCFSCEESQEKPGMYKNTLCWLDIQSGKMREFRRITTPEPTYIRGIRVSPMRQYLILLLKDRPFELWELRTFSLTRTFKPFTQVTALEWAIRDAPPPSPTTTHATAPTIPTSAPTAPTSSLSTPLSLNIPSFSSLASTIASLGSSRSSLPEQTSQTNLLSPALPAEPIPTLNDDDLDLHVQFEDHGERDLYKSDGAATDHTALNTLNSENTNSHYNNTAATSTAVPRSDTNPPNNPNPNNPNHSRSINTSFNNIYFSAEDESSHTTHHTMPEMFVFTSTDGMVRFFSVDGGNITPNEIQVDLGPGVVSSLAWKNDLLVSGDTAGAIHCWHLDKRKLQTYATHKGLIKRIRFSPASHSTNVLALFAGGDFGIWDLQHGIRSSISSYLFQREVKATEVDWLTESAPIITTTDGCVRVLDKSLSISNSRLSTTTLALTPDSLGLLFVPISTPHVLNGAVALHLKALLNHQSSNPIYSFEKDTAGYADISASLLALIDTNFPATLRPLSVAERCLQVARFFGDNQEIDFWTLAINSIEKFAQQMHYTPSSTPNSSMPSTPVMPLPMPSKKPSPFFSVLPRYPDSPMMSPMMSPTGSPRIRRQSHNEPSTPTATISTSPTTDLDPSTPDLAEGSPSVFPIPLQSHSRSGSTTGDGGVEGVSSLIFSQDVPPDPSLFEGSQPARQLPHYFDVLLPGETVKELEIERANVHGSKATRDPFLSKVLVEKNILVGRSDKSVGILLDTNADSPDFVANSLKACVVAASLGTDSFARTVKVVATNMIASNRVDEGVQLLCLIGKGLDACRYLQSYDRWHDAAVVAKSFLSETECGVIMRKWAQFLISSNQKLKAVHIYLSLGEFHKVLLVLRDLHKADIATLFAAACVEKKLLYIDPSTPSDTDANNNPDELPSSMVFSGELLNSSLGVNPASVSASLKILLENLHYEYGTMLQQVGCAGGASHYWAKSGRVGATSLHSAPSRKSSLNNIGINN